ncbi:MAG: hypothetical protein QXR60_01965 [Candidatus Nanoarchaeia archaeon]
MRFFFFFLLLSSNVFALAVTPSQLEFVDSRKAEMVVFNTEDRIKEYSLTLVGSGFSVDKSFLRIPPRSKDYVKVTNSCSDCQARLYVRELSDSAGIKVEPAVIVKLSAGNPSDDVEPDDYMPEYDDTSFLERPEILAFIITLSVTALSCLFFFGRKFYIKKFIKKRKSRKRK